MKKENNDNNNNESVDNDSLLINEIIKEIFANSNIILEEKDECINNTKSRIDNLYYYIPGLPGVDSIFSLFALRCIELNEISLSGISELYIEFVKECRWYWEHVLYIYIYISNY